MSKVGKATGSRRRGVVRAAALGALLLAGMAQASVSMASTTASASGTARAGTAGSDTATAACFLDAGSVTATGDHRSQLFETLSPIRRDNDLVRGKTPYAAGQVRLSSDQKVVSSRNFYSVTGHVVIGTTLYRSTYGVQENVPGPNTAALHRVGGGWGAFTTLVQSMRSSAEPAAATDRLYALRNDGSLYRWTVEQKEGLPPIYHPMSAPGFSAVKTMALLSRTPTYDTLLMTTRSGALYTARIPLTGTMKPVVKQVRSSTWQGFESLEVERCGNYGTVVLGIDKDTKTGNLYAVGHANGTATVIRSLGKAPGTFGDPVNFHWVQYTDLAPFGE
jgi:hypothetical protein